MKHDEREARSDVPGARAALLAIFLIVPCLLAASAARVGPATPTVARPAPMTTLATPTTAPPAPMTTLATPTTAPPAPMTTLATPTTAPPARPDTPLLLVPGWGDDGADVEPLREAFVRAGWPELRVRVAAFQDPFGGNEEHAEELAREVDRLRLSTGAERVDVVAHSMGGLAVRHYLHFMEGGSRVRRAVFLGTPHRGSMAAMLAWGDGGREMVPGSRFLDHLNEEDRGVPEGVEALAIRTPTDLRIIPASSAVLAGELNIEVCCPSHQELIRGDSPAFPVMVRFLVQGAEGVPRAHVPVEGVGEGEVSDLGDWSLWGDERAEEVVRWFLPSWRLDDVRDSAGDTVGARGDGG